MKTNFIKSLTLAAGTALCLLATGCDDEHVISYKNLPGTAQTFIETYFSGTSISRIVKEKDDGSKEYTVTLSDGTEIDFNSSGEWTSVETPYSVMPLGFLPASMSAYITTYYSAADVHSVEKETGGYEAEVYSSSAQPTILVFDTSGNFLRSYIDN